MAGIFNGPPRGGTRGGKDQFTWDSVKSDKDREYYLGHSVKALTGRWQKGKDVYWYTRDSKEEGAAARREHELAMVKQREQDLMAEALGIRPKAPRAPTQQPRLDKEDMQKLLGAGEESEEDAVGDADKVKGLGFNASRLTGAIQLGAEQERLDGVGFATGGSRPGPPQMQQQRQQDSEYPQHPLRDSSGGGDGFRGGRRGDAEEEERRKRKERKEENKAAKRAKKELKQEKKAQRRQEKHRGRSRSRSRSSGEQEEGERRRGRERSVERSSARRRDYGGRKDEMNEGERYRRGREGGGALRRRHGSRSRSRSPPRRSHGEESRRR